MQQYRIGEGPYGSAYQGTIDDLFGAGDLAPIEAGNRSFGLFLGQFDWQQTVSQTWEEPAKGLWGWLTRERVQRKHTEVLPQVQDLRFTGDQHHLIVASSGAGKFRDVLSNMLLYDGSCDTACLIIDPKGEIASTTGVIIDTPDARDPRTVILDPWDLCGTGGTDSLTLLDGIRADNPHCVKDARVLADAIIIERSTEDGHWVATTKNFLSALLLYLCLDPLEENERTLFRLRQIVTMPWSDLADLLGYMSDSNFFEGMVARAAQAMLNRDEKERRAILSTLERDTAFVEDPGLWKAIKTSSFDMNKLVLTNKRLHVIVPFDYTDQMSSWLRLTIAAFYNACLRSQLPANFPKYLRFRHIIIDEFAGLGKLDFIMKGIAEARGAGIKYHIVVQNFPQLNMLYKEGWENLVSNSLIHAFGVNDNFTAEYLSKLTGQSTVITEAKGYSESVTEGMSKTTGASSSAGRGGTTSGTSSSYSESFSGTKGTSLTFSSVGRPVLMPDEIRRLSNKHQLLFMREMPVVMARRTPYYETFSRFLPRYALADVLRSTKLLGQQQKALVPYGPAEFNRQSPLIEVNSRLRVSGFVPPPFRPYTFMQALLQSPGFICVVVAIIAATAWAIPTVIANQERQRQEQARAAQAAEAATIKAMEEQRLAAQRQEQAQEIDNRIRAPYSALATDIFATVSRLGLCGDGTAFRDFSCSTVAHYTTGEVAPFNLSLNMRKQQFLELTVRPQNVMRGDTFTGAAADITIRTVFDNVVMNTWDDRVFHSSFKTMLSAILRAFHLPDQTLYNCWTTDQGLSSAINGTAVKCHFTARPRTNGFSEFTLRLIRPM